MGASVEFGIAMKSMRSALGLSQLALAARLGSTQRHVSFLETGRSRVTLEFLKRLCSELNLSSAQRSALFEASGYRNPYQLRQMDSREVEAALDTIENRILRNWPFPAFALDQDWNLLRANQSAHRMFAAFGVDSKSDRPSMLGLVLSPEFRSAIINWEDASLGLYFRLQRASERNAAVKDAFEAARREGVFDHVPARITDQRDTAVLSAVEMRAPDGSVLQLTPFVGQLTSVHDVLLEGVEIEFMVPLDDVSDVFFRALSAGP